MRVVTHHFSVIWIRSLGQEELARSEKAIYSSQASDCCEVKGEGFVRASDLLGYSLVVGVRGNFPTSRLPRAGRRTISGFIQTAEA